jgi:hypothetical protein
MAENLVIRMRDTDVEFKYYVTSSVNGADNVVLYIRELSSENGDKVSFILTHYKYDDTWYGTYLADSDRNGIHINYRTPERNSSLDETLFVTMLCGPSLLEKAESFQNGVFPKDFKEIENREAADALLDLNYQLFGGASRS